MLTVAVEKTLGEFRIDARFDGESGATGLFGPSGSGKTSIINMIAGLMTPDRGRVVLDELVLFDSTARIDMPVAQRRIGYVFQEGRLFPHLSIKSNLDYGRWMTGFAADTAAFARVVELLDVGHLLDRRPGKLSGGERQRVAIAALLAQDAPLLLLDEPLTHLDLRHQVQVLRHLGGLAVNRGKGVLMSLHDLNLAARFASHVLIFTADGALRQGPVAQVMTEPVLYEAFGHRVIKVEAAGQTLFVAE